MIKCLIKKLLIIFIFLAPILLSAGCSQSPEKQEAKARKELNIKGIEFSQKSLIKAVANHDSPTLALLLKAGYDPNFMFRFSNAFTIKNYPEFTPNDRQLLFAIARMNDGIAVTNTIIQAQREGFISAEASIKMTNIASQLSIEGTPLMFAAGQGDLDIVKLLLSGKADPNTLGYDPNIGMSSNALTLAIAGLHTQIVKLLLENKADPKIRDLKSKELLINYGTGIAYNNKVVMELNQDQQPNKAEFDKIKAMLKSYF